MQKILEYKRTHAFLVLVAAIVIFYKMEYPTATVRYKLTVEIDTPEGVKTGSAVRDITIWRQPQLLPNIPTILSDVKGEAVVVDLGQRGVVFGLLRGAGGAYDAHRFLEKALPPPRVNAREYVLYYKNLDKASRALTPEAYPAFVYFRDIKDPKTVEALLIYRNVGQGWITSQVLDKDRFTEAFGEGVALKSVTIEMTREPVTKGVVERYTNACCVGAEMAIEPSILLGGYDFIVR